MEERSVNQTVTIKDRKVLLIDRVINIIGLEDYVLTLDTECGRITVEGSGLKVESLDRSDGVITVNGNIEGVSYSDNEGRRGRFSRLFG